MQLKKSQVHYIEQDLLQKGIHYPPLREDLLDHICTEVEKSLDSGKKFKDAHRDALALFLPQELLQVQYKTTQYLTSMSLFKSYFQTAYRNLNRHKALSAINIFGLTTSLSICILIFIFIRYELSYDQQHPESNIYRLVSQIKQENGQISSTAFTGAPWGPAMVQEFPELMDFARIMKYRLDVIVTNQYNQQTFYEPDLIWGDQQLLQFFDIDLILGNPKNALSQPHSVVISEDVAKKYFGSNDALGQVITYNNDVNLTVTGVMKNMPDNMHFKAEIICSFNTLNSFWSIINNWGILYYHTYFTIQEGSNVQSAIDRFEDFFNDRMGHAWTEKRWVDLQDVRDIHLNTDVSDGLKAGTNVDFLYILAAVALIILFLACANFINLNIARSLKRTREVGIRKVMGGLKADLIHQFLLESGFLTLFSLICALLLAQLVLPFFNQLLGKELTLLTEFDGLLIICLFIIMLIISILAGIYPAIIASRMETLMALKGKCFDGHGKGTFGKGLILLQFVICTSLVIVIGTVKLQQQYLLSKDLGYSQEKLLILSTTNIDHEKLPLVKNELLSLPGIRNVSITSHQLAGDQPYYGRYAFAGTDHTTDTLGLGRLHIDEGFVDTYDLRLVTGRNFNPKISTDTSSFLINETTADLLGVTPKEALNISISYLTQGANGRYNRTGRIIGVLEDFHLQSLHQEIEGLVMDIQHPRAHFIACKLVDGSNSQLFSQVEDIMAQFIENIPLDYFFIEDQLKTLYSAELTMDVLISLASIIAIIIAFLGLLALITQLTSYKKREIGLRKVLGASTLSITAILSEQYSRIIFLSLLIAFPISYLWMDHWLQNYPYRIEFPILWMISAGMLILCLSFGVISLVTIRVANADPIKSLKEE